MVDITERHLKEIVLSINTCAGTALTLRRMGHGELEVEVTIANSGVRRQLWISAVPGVRPGRRVCIETPRGQQWWRIVNLGQIRLREAATLPIDLAAPIDLAS